MILLAALLFTFARNGATTIPCDTAAGVPWVEARINGSRPLWFVVDTGSSRMLIDDALLPSLKLTKGEAGSVQGAGAGRVGIVAIREPVTVAVSGLASREHHFDAIDLSGVSRSLGRDVAGILGHEFFERFMVTIDYAQKRMTISEPGRAAVGKELPLEFERKWPLVRATITIDGKATEDRFLVDTGSADEVDHPRIRDAKDVRQTRTGVGLGEATSGWVGSGDFTIGGTTIEGVTVACCGATEATSRLMGSGVLRRFVVTFDYSRKRIWLRATAVPPA